MNKVYRIRSDYQTQYPYPITMRAGDQIEVSDKQDLWDNRPEWVWVWCTNRQGKSGWVPKEYIAQHGDMGIALRDYAATELSVQAGEEVTVEQEESGWAWCTNRQGQSGWVPLTHIQPRGEL
ncbi:MAG TPA: SH3 domain-containing protein [Ktedonobacteraceae bacterium]|jgi:uncharacterized protein YgiM (DUF1202 family)|nr:SH3 domain-containing protein [Ktedonobacteraceae bacterium]